MGGVDGGGRLVLVVEDNDKKRKLARDLLGFRGFRVAGAATATDALIAARAEPPDLVLMDVALPDMDGIEALHLLRADPLTKDVPRRRGVTARRAERSRAARTAAI